MHVTSFNFCSLKHRSIKSESEKQTNENCPTVVNAEENLPSSEAVASTSTGEMAVNYTRHPHPRVLL